MKKTEIIEKLEKLTSLDEYDVNDKYTEIPIEYQIKGEIVSVMWKCRHEEARNEMYDLSVTDEVRSLTASIDHVIEDLIEDEEYEEKEQPPALDFELTKKIPSEQFGGEFVWGEHTLQKRDKQKDIHVEKEFLLERPKTLQAVKEGYFNDPCKVVNAFLFKPDVGINPKPLTALNVIAQYWDKERERWIYNNKGFEYPCYRIAIEYGGDTYITKEYPFKGEMTFLSPAEGHLLTIEDVEITESSDLKEYQIKGKINGKIVEFKAVPYE